MPSMSSQSFRLACDRCRLHKLKCPETKAATHMVVGACQRCIRAKVQCTFSPRARTGRPSERGRERAASTKEYERTKEIEREEGRDSGMEKEIEMEVSGLAVFSPSPDAIEPQKITASTGLASGVEPSPGYEMDAAGSPDTQMLVFGPNTTADDQLMDMGEATSDLAWMDINQLLIPELSPDNWMVTPEKNAALESSSMDSTPDYTYEREQSHGVPEVPGTALISSRPPLSLSNSIANGHGLQNLQMLVILAADLHKQLESITEESWEDSRALQNYPVGNIIHLSQQLANIIASASLGSDSAASLTTNLDETPQFHPDCAGIKDLLNTSSSQLNWTPPTSPESLNPTTSTHKHSTSESVSLKIDTPAALLLISCYVSLTRIWSLACIHFYTHLCSVSPLSKDIIRPQSCPGQHLEDLQPWDGICTKIYTALRMLLDVIAHTEETIDIPHVFRCVQPKASAEEEISEEKSPHNGTSQEPSTGLMDGGLLEAVLIQEIRVSARTGGGGPEVRKNIDRLKHALQKRMKL